MKLKQISIKKATKILREIKAGLYAEFISSLLVQTVIERSTAYELCGSIVIKTPSWDKKSDVWYICDIGNSDMNSTFNEIQSNNDEKLDIIMIHAKQIDGEYCYIFSAIGSGYMDLNVVKLSGMNINDVLMLTTVEDDGDIFNKTISQNIYNDFLKLDKDKAFELYGLYVNKTLVGAISIENRSKLGVVIIRELFVSKSTRGKGYAKRLLKSALGLYPNMQYFYSCGSDNTASIATAKSCGFVFEGTYDFI